MMVALIMSRDSTLPRQVRYSIAPGTHLICDSWRTTSRCFIQMQFSCVPNPTRTATDFCNWFCSELRSNTGSVTSVSVGDMPNKNDRERHGGCQWIVNCGSQIVKAKTSRLSFSYTKDCTLGLLTEKKHVHPRLRWGDSTRMFWHVMYPQVSKKTLDSQKDMPSNNTMSADLCIYLYIHVWASDLRIHVLKIAYDL